MSSSLWTDNFHDFYVDREQERCIQCLVCVRQCPYEANVYREAAGVVDSVHKNCTGCHRCESLCPTRCITIRTNPSEFRPHANWQPREIKNIYKQARTGGVLLTSTGCELPYPNYFDRILIDACQVTNPSIDPLREPMELRTYIGRKPEKLEFERTETGEVRLKTEIAPQLKCEVPILFSAMSYGAVNLNFCEALAMTAKEVGTYWNTGEGGLHRKLYPYGDHTIVQCASGRFGVSKTYLGTSAAIEIKIGQGAKPGIGGHLPGEKVNRDISETRMIPVGSDAISPAPHHDIYSIEDLRQLIFALKEATDYEKPVFVKIAAVHNSAAIASGIARAGADAIVIDGFRGGTGATPLMIRDNVGIPIELAIAAVDDLLRAQGIRNEVSLIAAGGIRNSADVVKIIALGADAVYIGTAAKIAVGCTVCQRCYTGKCPWGITTNDPRLAKRLNVEIAAEQLTNLIHGWAHEIKEMMGLMGINAIESLRGNRERLRGVGLTDRELNILGIKHAGE
ncbi:MAG: FMN-binding glutamate synthase family protein [Deltaproteobacteria bacterium]|nr:MAG: FMN-binding glutamate synthase family protein [Deltaproteobacteria bacterium]